MKDDRMDLAALSRGRVAETLPAAASTQAGSTIPAPSFRWRTRVLLPGVILLALASTLLYAARDAFTPAVAVHVIPVVVRTIEGSTSAGVVQAAGWLEPDPFPIAVSALTEGIVKDVLVLEGEKVVGGQVVARLVDDEARLALRRLEAEYQEAEADLASADAGWQAARSAWDNPIELHRRVAAARAGLAEKEAELARWPAQLAAEEARAAELLVKTESTIDLNKQGAVGDPLRLRAQRELDTQRALVEAMRMSKGVLEAQAAAMRAELTAANDTLVTRIDDARTLRTSEADVQRARAALDRTAAMRDEARLRLERMQVRAPADGVVMVRLVEPGSKIMLGDNMPTSAQVVKLYDPSKLQVRVDVPLANAAGLSPGQPAEIVVDVLPDRVFKGRLTRIVHEADLQKNTLQVKVAVDDPSPDLKPEMLSRVKLAPRVDPSVSARVEAVFALERYLIDVAKDRASAWVADARGRVAQKRSLTLGGHRQDGWVAVNEGLRPGDRLIAETDGLAPGRRIKIVGELWQEK